MGKYLSKMPQVLPLKIDIYSLWIFLGIIQALFLAYFFLFGKQAHFLANKFLGVLLIAFAAALSEILLCYTNYMFRVIWLIDFAEPTNLLFAPLIFIYHKTLLGKQFKKSDWLHFLPFVAYIVYLSITFYSKGYPEKYNAYLNAYHHDTLPQLTYEYTFPEWIYLIRDYINELMLLQMCVYAGLGISVLREVSNNERMSFWSNQNQTFVWCRRGQLYSILATIVFVVTKLLFPHDLGDHFIAAYLTFLIYGLSFTFMNQPEVFTPRINKKYEKSSLTSEIQENTLEKIQLVMQNEKPFLDSSFSLPSFAKRLGVSPHHLSQILNESLGQTFFDFTAQHRINEAREMLSSPTFNHLKIEEIAEMVGYNSKSAFNTAFKKFTGKTPSSFRTS